MPLAAPVMIATLSEKRGISAFLSRVCPVIEDYLAEAERQIGDVVGGRNHRTHRQQATSHIAYSTSWIATGPTQTPFTVTSPM
jgi:hypothetical protein